MAQVGKELVLLTRLHGHHLPGLKVLLLWLLSVGGSLALGVHGDWLRGHEVGRGIESRRVLQIDDGEALSVDHGSVVVWLHRHCPLPLVLGRVPREVTHTREVVARGRACEQLVLRKGLGEGFNLLVGI